MLKFMISWKIIKTFILIKFNLVLSNLFAELQFVKKFACIVLCSILGSISSISLHEDVWDNFYKLLEKQVYDAYNILSLFHFIM